MKSGDSRFWILPAFLLTLAAGAAAGMLAYRFLPGISGSRTQDTRSPLAAELNLTPDQARQMQKIWESVQQTAGASLLQGKALEMDREKAYEAILTPAQKSEYDKIKADYNARIEQLKSQRDGVFQKALEQTRALLTEPQRQKYEKLLHDRTGRDLQHELDLDNLNSSGKHHGSPATQP